MIRYQITKAVILVHNPQYGFTIFKRVLSVNVKNNFSKSSLASHKFNHLIKMIVDMRRNDSKHICNEDVR